MSVRKLVHALYGRTSKDDPKRVTIEIQQQQLREWSVRDQLVERVYDEYWDDGVSGKVPLWERPNGKRLLDDVRTGKVEAVAVMYVDRFGRTLLDGQQAVKMIEDQGVKLVAVTDGWDSRRNDSPLYFQFRMMMAEEEHRRISQRMTSGKQRAMDRDNAPPGGPLVFGYGMNEHGQYVIEAAEAELVVRIFQMALRGESHQSILNFCQTSGIAPGRKFQKRVPGSLPTVAKNHLTATWHLSKIGKILRCRTYLGERTWGSRRFPCTPLIDQVSFDKMQVMVKEKSKKFGIGKFDPTKGIVSGMFRCAICQSPFYHKATITKRDNGTSDHYQMYVCDNQRRGGGCHAKMIRVDWLDKQVWQHTLEYVSSPELFLNKVLASNVKAGIAVADLEKAELSYATQMAEIDAEVQSVWAEQEANGWPMSWVSTRLNKLSTHRDKVKRDLDDIRTQRATILLHRTNLDEVTSSLATIRVSLGDGDPVPIVKYNLVRLLVVGGLIETIGSGHHKGAKIHAKFIWDYTLMFDAKQAAPRKVPKQCYNGTNGDATIPIVITLSSQELR